MSDRTFIYKETDDEDGKEDADEANLVAVLVDFFEELFFGLDAGHFGEIVSDSCQDGIPDAGSQCGEQEEGAELHAGQSGWDGDELAHGGYQSADEGGNGSMLVEEIFGVLHFGFVDKAHVSEAAVGKFIDNGTTEPLGQIIIDESTDGGTDGGEEDNEIDIEASVTGCGLPCCRGDYHF